VYAVSSGAEHVYLQINGFLKILFSDVLEKIIS
jgi:hypothetical protein